MGKRACALLYKETLARLLWKPQTADVPFNVRDYHAVDFERLWQIDQLCFPQGVSYTQMELSGFITRRNAITLVADSRKFPNVAEKRGASGRQLDNGLETGAKVPCSAAIAQAIGGFVIAHPFRGKMGRILTLDIVPEVRRLGLASLLMDECERRLRSFDCKEIYLETAVNNEPALRLYRKLGYEVLRTLPNYYSSHSLDAFLMGKPL